MREVVVGSTLGIVTVSTPSFKRASNASIRARLGSVTTLEKERQWVFEHEFDLEAINPERVIAVLAESSKFSLPGRKSVVINDPSAVRAVFGGRHGESHHQ